MPFYLYSGFTSAYTFKITMQWLYAFLPIFWLYAFNAERWLTPSEHPPPRNGGMAMAIPMTTLEDRLCFSLDECKYNPDWILVYCK
jgi:hypothetical protein